MSPLHSHFLHHCSSAMVLTTCFQKYFFVGLQFALNVAKEVTHGFHRLVVHVRGNAVLLRDLVATDIVYRRVGCHFRQGEAGLILAVIFITWFAWVFYLLLAPLKKKDRYSYDHYYR